MNFIALFFIFFILILPKFSFAAPIWDESAGIGYWFYKEPIFSDSKKTSKISASRCLNGNAWSADCGFIDPTKLGLSKDQAFIFEQKEYKELLRNLSMNAKDNRAVLEWQKFNHWAINQAMAAAYGSEFNIAQHPELDSTIAHPFSQFGNLIVKNVNNAMQENLFNMLSKTSLLVFFTRSNCSFCHYQADVMRILEEKTHIPVWNASLDKNYLPHFNYHLVAPETLKPAQYLHVSTVPAIFLYLAPQAGGHSQEHWIRLATGLTSVDVIENRILRFVQDYKRGLTGVNRLD